MSQVVLNISMSLDGFIAGSNDSQQSPLGDDGDILHAWMFSGDKTSEVNPFFKLSQIDRNVFDLAAKKTGAMIVGRRTYDIVKGWGGSHPLKKVPVFVLTNKIPKEYPKGSTPFTFITEGIEQAVEQAKRSAGTKDVSIGTASIAQQCIQTGLLEAMDLHIAPVLLGKGVRLFDEIGQVTVRLKSTQVLEGTGVVHVKYDIMK
ncbi:dihydrofolate reductase [Sediminibacillus dalangtanensis]|uniref:Dihydrofolate reductase n=1 Tax=Sediminibacillus dalangtanensis TaxID=2729421 RepID=A0ABX7VN28_9BACI|nr:dihydrofolate reductase family protein [Sediminibacillus dalangtanensis]QTM98242.1 dihydrofolate reductase [Sediminibacillus dalangtanensis]